MIIQLRALRAAAMAVCAALLLSGCLSAKTYIDPGLSTVSRADIPVTANPRPVQMLFEFRTKGSANARATKEIRPRVAAVAAESGLFTTVSGEAGDAAGGPVFKLVIDNVPITDNAAAKGFGTGLTFGLVGSMVSDGYVVTASYSRDGKTTETTLKHALHTTIGNHSGPPGLTAMKPVDAVYKAMDQVAWNVLKQLAEKKAFED